MQAGEVRHRQHLGPIQTESGFSRQDQKTKFWTKDEIGLLKQLVNTHAVMSKALRELRSQGKFADRTDGAIRKRVARLKHEMAIGSEVQDQRTGGLRYSDEEISALLQSIKSHEGDFDKAFKEHIGKYPGRTYASLESCWNQLKQVKKAQLEEEGAYFLKVEKWTDDEIARLKALQISGNVAAYTRQLVEQNIFPGRTQASLTWKISKLKNEQQPQLVETQPGDCFDWRVFCSFDAFMYET